MGKLLCDSATVTPPQTPPLITWRDPPTTPSTPDFPSPSSWDDVTGLEDQQRRNLSRLQAKGVLWKHPEDKSLPPVVFKLTHGGDVDADGNCLFSAVEKAAMWGLREGECGGARELRRRTVQRFEKDFGSAENDEKLSVELAIKNLYSPDLKCGWGIHVVQELKLLAPKSDRQIFDDAILELLNLGMLRETAAESIYKERCIAVDDGPSWAKYMSISGSPDDEYDIITLQYTEEGLLTVDENREGRAAAFGDDIAIECLSTEFKREIYVVQAHGSDAMVDEDNCVFFLPHRPRGWCGAGADHYEPLIAHPSSVVSQEKVGFIL
ncbi:Pre-mRNA-splicing factor CLF1 [Bienertia sinuspersici]